MITISQAGSAALFTAIRIFLHFVIYELLRNILSRTYNLTYIERVDSGIISKFSYVFFTKFRIDNHTFGRIVVLITLIVSALLTIIPTYLSNLYPVKALYPESSYKQLQYDLWEMKNIQPGKTGPIDLLTSMGVQVNQSIFHSYNNVVNPVETQCYHVGNVSSKIGMNCTGSIPVTFTPIDKMPCSVLDYTCSNNKTLIDGTNYYYFDFESEQFLDLVSAYYKISKVNIAGAGKFGFVTSLARSSIDSCLSYNLITELRWCARSSFGLLQYGNNVVTVEKKLTSQRTWTKLDDELCSLLPTPSLRDMCDTWKLNEKVKTRTDVEDYSGLVSGAETVTETPLGYRWDIFWVQSTSPQSISRYVIPMIIGSISIEFVLKSYSISSPTNNATCLKGYCTMYQEMAEATDMHDAWDNQNYGLKDPQETASWINWGFSQDDIKNMTEFMLQSSPILNGGVTLASPELLVVIPEYVIIIITCIILIILAVACFVGKGVDPIVTKPLSEVIATTTKTYKEPRHFWSKKRVANFTLRKQMQSQESLDMDKCKFDLYVDDFRVNYDDIVEETEEGEENEKLNDSTSDVQITII